MSDSSPNGSGKTEDLIGYPAAAQLLGVKVSTVYSWVYHKYLPHFRISARCVRFSRAALHRWLAERAVPAGTAAHDTTAWPHDASGGAQ
jgi:excisionase family DNA binding protein